MSHEMLMYYLKFCCGFGIYALCMLIFDGIRYSIIKYRKKKLQNDK